MQMNASEGRQSRASEFHHSGVIQQLSARLIWFGRLIDGAIIFATLFVTTQRFGIEWGLEHLLAAFAFIFVFELITSFFDIYRSWRMVRLRHELAKLSFHWLVSAMLLVFMLYALNGSVSMPKPVIYLWLTTAYVLACFMRVAIRLALRYARAAGYDMRRVAFFGSNELAYRLIRTFQSHPWMGMDVVGVFDYSADDADGSGQAVSGSLDDLVQLARSGNVDAVYISQPLDGQHNIPKLVDSFADSTVSIYYCPSFADFQLVNARWDNVFGQPVLSLVESPFVGHARWLKSLEDIVLLVLLGPWVLFAIALISLAQLVTSGRPVFFRQSRHGLDGRQFWIWKFRTMYPENCQGQFEQAKRDDPRVTPFGAILRKTSLDELPQIFNIIKGEMSFVGPRPHPDSVNELLRKDIYQYMLRHKIKPGITGLAQVSGYRGETETLDLMEKRIELDLYYVKNWSLLLDLKILFNTIFELTGDNTY